MTTSKRNKVLMVRETISQLKERIGELIPIEEIEKELDGKMNSDEIDAAIIELKKNSIIYEPRRGYVQKM
jgi:DNA replicative helicase MCM subunit Mcm2 (Cdc46/Mcm family)